MHTAAGVAGRDYCEFSCSGIAPSYQYCRGEADDAEKTVNARLEEITRIFSIAKTKPE